MDFDGARFLHETAGMKRTGAVRVVMILLTVVAIGCQDSRSVSPAAASLFIPNVQGVWSGPMTLLATSGGECVAGIVPTFLPTLDFGTITLSQDNDTLAATITMESTGLACRYTGSATSSSVALNATSCDRTGLFVTCINGVPRELKLVGSSVTASWNGNQFAGRTTSTYNVLTVTDGIGVGSLVATHDFNASRR
jgi:hypothetical protein